MVEPRITHHLTVFDVLNGVEVQSIRVGDGLNYKKTEARAITLAKGRYSDERYTIQIITSVTQESNQ